jgi:hypothetical protein
LVAAAKAEEDRIAFGRRDTRPRVIHLHDRAVAALPQGELYLTARWREFGGVVYDISDCFEEEVRISLNRAGLRNLSFECQASFFGNRRIEFVDAANDSREVDFSKAYTTARTWSMSSAVLSMSSCAGELGLAAVKARSSRARMRVSGVRRS